MKSFHEMWEELSSYLNVEKGLDVGYADGKYTRFFAKYCKQVDGIDISEDYAVDEISYNDKEEFLEDMISWWAEVKISKDDNEKEKMKKQIAEILEKENMLTVLTFHDVFRYTVYRRA